MEGAEFREPLGHQRQMLCGLVLEAFECLVSRERMEGDREHVGKGMAFLPRQCCPQGPACGSPGGGPAGGEGICLSGAAALLCYGC